MNITPGDRDRFDVVVVGGGHAGCEAGMAAARMGLKTLMVTMNLEKIALMPCNPAIGGVGKGQLTREIDALGGQQGRIADSAAIQMKMLNTSKGPAVQALRAQTDKKLYEDNMKRRLAETGNLYLLEGNVASIIVSRETIRGITLDDSSEVLADAVILACGTFLRGNIVIGDKRYEAGRMGEPPAMSLSSSLMENGLELSRFQSATPPRIDARSINTEAMQLDPGDAHPEPFSAFSSSPITNRAPCYLTYTNPRTHDLVREYLHLSPIKTGSVSSKGPRYCPSIDRKIMNFPDRDHHPVFVEPEGLRTKEVYLQGLTTSLPVWVQEKLIHATPGLENARLMRPGYAVEYDYVLPSQLSLSLESLSISNLFLAGQINGTSGYEEAASQGLLAGINASLRVKGEAPFILSRSDAYIGVLIDDLVTKKIDEPYRIFTSRAEYRLLLRHDNAHRRLSPIGHSIGLLSPDDYRIVSLQEERVTNIVDSLRRLRLKPGIEINSFLESRGSSPLEQAQTAFRLVTRPEVSLHEIYPLLVSAPGFDVPDSPGDETLALAETEIKYHGYIERQLKEIERRSFLEEQVIPDGFNFDKVSGLSLEAVQKLSRFRPQTLGQASRIAGVSPADISLLSIKLKSFHHDLER